VQTVLNCERKNMPSRPLLYYITDRHAFPGDEQRQRHRLLDKIAVAAANGIDYIQLREKDLSTRELESLAREAMGVIRENQVSAGNRQETQLLINSRTDIALAVKAAGIQLRGTDISPEDVRTAWQRSAAKSDVVIGASCHSPDEALQAAAHGASFAVFAPVFEKKDAPETQAKGIEALGSACVAKIPVFALGGITLENSRSCLCAGAIGIAAIRLFQENDISVVVHAFS
jgi:thiamine-phosphate pyrophosphorylase